MFEAKGIQRYIFASGKLRDVVGASDLVAGLANSDGGKPESPEPDEISKFWNDAASFSRRAGGAFCIHSGDKDPLVELRAKWRHFILTQLPGLEFVDVIASAKGDKPLEAMRACFREAGGIRTNYPSEVPGLGRPISKIAPLTGRPAVKVKRYGDKNVLVDAIGLPQRVHADKTKLDSIAKRFVTDAENWKFPRNYDEGEEVDPDKNPLFPFEGGDKRIAVIHADLSGLGELFRNMGRKYKTAEENFNLAKSIEEAITTATKRAVADVIVGHAVGKVLPARPVLLGGDDITIIVRADLAIPFTAKLLKNIEDECKSIGAPSENALSSCAGIAIVGKGTPFLTAYALADDLCNHAKTRVKAAPVTMDDRIGYASAYSFHVYQHTALDAYEGAIADNEVDAAGKPLSANPYIVGDRKPDDSIDLIDLANTLANIEGAPGRMREIKSLISDNIDLAKAAWERWWEVGDKKQSKAMECLKGCLKGREFKDGSSGIFDAMTLIDLGAVNKKQAEVVA